MTLIQSYNCYSNKINMNKKSVAATNNIKSKEYKELTRDFILTYLFGLKLREFEITLTVFIFLKKKTSAIWLKKDNKVMHGGNKRVIEVSYLTDHRSIDRRVQYLRRGDVVREVASSASL